ncbi:MAG: hypothetical protein KDA41_20370, partial [Planctomycetales bacterium]|nr:hypothetical protein [Planctomycetales bacterium]
RSKSGDLSMRVQEGEPVRLPLAQEVRVFEIPRVMIGKTLRLAWPRDEATAPAIICGIEILRQPSP